VRSSITRGLRPERLFAAVTTLVLVAGLAGGPRAAQAGLPDDKLQRAVLATAQVLPVDEKKQVLGRCSGTVVNPAGLILTNFHCVGQTDLYGKDETGKYAHGQVWNPEGLVAIAPTLDANKAPKVTYWAKVVGGTADLDLAVLKIDKMATDGEALPNPLPLVPVPLANSDAVKLQEDVFIFGYPGAGGNTITVTSGKIAGQSDFELKPDGTNDAFKVDGAINPGNSGGLATNDKGEMIGVPTAGRSGTGIGTVRMMNAAVPYIDKALKDPKLPTPAQPAEAAKPAAPAVEPGYVLLRGQVVDADTKEPIPAAWLVILKPDVSLLDWLDEEDEDASDEMVAAYGYPGADGTYITFPPLESGKAYSFGVFAKGYSPRLFDNGLRLRAADVGVIKLPAIELRKR